MKILNRGLLMLGLLFTTFLLGVTVALMPVGVSARVAIIMIAILFLVTAWGFRQTTAMFPERKLIIFSAFVLTMSIVWPQYIFFSAGGLPRVNPFTLSTAMGLIFILALTAHYRSFSSRMPLLIAEIKPVAIFFGLWIVWRAISNLLSGAPVATNTGLLRELIYVYSLFAYGLFVCQGKNGIQLLGRIIVACTVIVGLAGIVEALQGKNMFIGFAASGETGDVGDAIATIIADKVRGGAYRVQSVFSHPILFGQFLGAAAPIVLVSFLLDRSRAWRLVALIALPLIMIGILKSGSRSGVMALVVSGAVLGMMLWVYLLTNSKKYSSFAIVAVPVVLIVILAAYGIGEHLIAGGSRTESGSSMVRAVQLQLALNAIPNSPFFGYGLGAAVQIAGVKTYLNALTMDIYYLSVLLDSGWVGLALFFAMVLSLIVTSLRYVSSHSGRNMYYVSAYMAAAISVLVTLGAVSMPQNIMFVMLAAGVLAVAKHESRAQ
ncbi:O-antigen ligase family protein [Sulfuriferula thiophila]|uniref:O-antigen ligase family protein n=1 Tax=Sulfuriferula thiophila TaxID=1781211 RepID=UPI000F614C55|nr:O-antigen ligase family protein [Sulfuriferula thiophila]